jgi:MutS domain V/MutS domain III
MKDQQLPSSYYTNRIQVLSSQLTELVQKRKMYAWARFLTISLAIAGLWQLWPVNVVLAFTVFILLLIAFFIFLSRDLKNNSDIKNTEILIKINEQEILVLKHQYTHLPDGLQYKPAKHNYANDLDIFGKASLYQYINRTTAEQAGQLLSKWLLAPATNEIIIARQEAVKELNQKTEWRQQLQAIGTEKRITIETERKISIWLKEENKFSGSFWKAVRVLYPVITLSLLFLFIIEIIPTSVFTFLFILFLVLSSSVSKMIMPAYNQLSKITGEVETLSDSILHIEKEKFNSSLLQHLQQSFQHNSLKASGIIRQLKSILDRFDYRLNIVVFIPLNAFLLWDLQQVLLLERWKVINKQQVKNWYEGLASFESLSTLGNLSFNHPNWCCPILAADKGVFTTKEMGHPLIPTDKIVNNTFSTDGIGKINLVTGSNMAGKSTFLRSIGINTVLAMAGSPVCAEQLTLHPTRIISTMRVNDNLEESTSTFYAELKKLKTIIEAVNNGENVFLLLDEILRGTNSLDRHTGSEALLKQLIKHNAVGLLATHDLELAKLINQYPSNITNYHFDVQVNNEELYFDYKLKRGICQSMNASLLMKKIGIEL